MGVGDTAQCLADCLVLGVQRVQGDPVARAIASAGCDGGGRGDSQWCTDLSRKLAAEPDQPATPETSGLAHRVPVAGHVEYTTVGKVSRS